MPRMKGIFRNILHIGGGHEGQRSNDSGTATSSESSFIDHRSNQCSTSARQPSPSPSSSSSSAPSPAGATGVGTLSFASGGEERKPSLTMTDFYQSEEEFQYQLALAISASNNAVRDDPARDTLTGLGHSSEVSVRVEDAAEAQSRRYWDYDVLDYEDKVLDGFYDILGMSTDRGGQGKTPSLFDLQTNVGDLGFEIVIVNRAIDPALEEMEQISHCIAMDCRDSGGGIVKSRLVQRIADVIVEHMGGPVRDANDILVRWIENSSKLRSSLQTSFLPIGCSNVGLSRHRALLFKVIADSVGVPCRLVKGSHYIGVDDGAVNMIKLEDDREFLVDLMGAPGTLIPADIFSTITPATTDVDDHKSQKSPPSKSAQASFPDIPTMGSLNKEYKGNNSKLGTSMTLETPDSIKSSGSNSAVDATQPDGVLNQQGTSVLSAAPSSSNQRRNGTTAVAHEVKEKLNITPYPQEPVDPKQLFADLNPFRIHETGKVSFQTRINDKVNEFPRHKENISTGRGKPPIQAAWKQRANETPKTKQHEFVEGLLPRKNIPVKSFNASPSSMSSTMDNIKPEHMNIHVSKVSGVSNVKETESYDVAGKLLFQINGFQGQSARNEDNYNVPFRRRLSQTTEVHEPKIYAKDVAHDAKMGVDDGPMLLKEQESSNVTDHPNSSKAYPMLDDVAECEIPWEDLVIGERIGLGSYGEVFHADWNGTEVAVKKFLDQEFSGDALQEFKTEVKIMRRLRHPNVVLFIGAVTRPPHLSIVTEFLPRGSLYKILHRPNCQIDEKRRIKMAIDVASGMNCLHSSVPTVVHRDLKSPNLLVDKNWNVKVCDFGLSRLKHHTFLSSKSTAGTPEWMAPEVLRNEPSNEKCDIYSFGVILWELATLRMPWSGMNPMQVVGAVGFQNRRLEIPKEVDPLVARLIWECWQTEPNLRPSFTRLTTVLNSLHHLVVPNQNDSQS